MLVRRAALALVALLALLIVAGIALWRWATVVPVARPFPPPPKTAWAPVGARTAGATVSPVIPEPDAFRTMHVGVNNTDELWTVAAPMVALAWTAETDMYVAEGPTFDNAGNLYFSPYNPREDVSLVALDRRTGRRRWSVPGGGAGGGAILVLNDPDAPGEQRIYHATYTTAMALRPDGTVIWQVPTGLTLPEREPGAPDFTHAWGMNYHPQADAVLSVTMDGHVVAHDRRTGRPLLAEPFPLPGSPAAVVRRLPWWITTPGNRATDEVFGRTIDDRGLFTVIADVVFGNGVEVANYYAVDPNSGRIYIAATAPDELDGARDGQSRSGALYLLELTADPTGAHTLRIVGYYPFAGGTGSTPTVSADGERVLVSDENGNVIALDAQLEEQWRINVGAQVAASIAVSSDNAEIYAVTQYDVIKLFDRGDSAEIAWRATLDAFPGFANFNALTPTITANGIAVSVGGGRAIGPHHLMHTAGVALLDRDTGTLRSFAPQREESIAITSLGPDGGYYLASSPVRRAITRGLLGERVPPLLGGIQAYRPVRLDLLVRDAACAGAARARNTATIAAAHPLSARDDRAQLGVLIRQARAALPDALAAGDLPAAARDEIDATLQTASAQLAAGEFPAVADSLSAVCDRFD